MTATFKQAQRSTNIKSRFHLECGGAVTVGSICDELFGFGRVEIRAHNSPTALAATLLYLAPDEARAVAAELLAKATVVEAHEARKGGAA